MTMIEDASGIPGTLYFRFLDQSAVEFPVLPNPAFTGKKKVFYFPLF